MSSPEPESYRVSCSKDLLARLRSLAEHVKTIDDETHALFLESLKGVNQRLENDPLGWGDPLYTYEESGLLMCHGMFLLLHSYYGVSEEKKLVFVKEIEPLPGRLPGFTYEP